MSGIDNRVVSMKFDNAQFERGISQTSKSLDKLNNSLKLKNGGKGLDDIASKVKAFTLRGILGAVESLKQKFSALGVIGVTALANITNRVVNAGVSLAKMFAIQPITDGFHEYETKIGSIQTILANTAKYGTSLKQVNKALDDLNVYADKTIYSFGDMTKNIGLFTNSGLRVEDATSMIKGFSNEAAASGVTAERAAGAAYQLSQALSTGTVRLMDWRSLTNAGMGSANMRQGLLDVAEAMGTVSASGLTASDIQKDFNGSLEKGWLSADVMSNYLKIMAGDMDVAQMKALGLSDAQISGLQKQAQTAEEAATKVRTFTQLVGTLMEAVGSGWSETFEILFGDFDKATELWTSISDTLGKVVEESSDARNDLLKGWDELGGREDVIDGLTAGVEALGSVLKAIGKAWSEVFPPATAQSLKSLSSQFSNFMKSLKPAPETLNNITRIFKGLFAAGDIVVTILKKVGSIFIDLDGNASNSSNGLLAFAASIGDAIVKFDQFLKSSKGFNDAFKYANSVITSLGKKISDFLNTLAGAPKTVGEASSSFNVLTEIGKTLAKIFGSVLDKFGKIFSQIYQIIDGFFQQISSSFSSGASSIDFGKLTSILNTGLLGGILAILRKFFKEGISLNFQGGFLPALKNGLEALTKTLQTMQHKLKSEILKNIAISIGILAASLFLLSTINPGRLSAALAGITALMAELYAFMAIFDKTTSGSFKGLAKAVGSMLLLSVAILILSSAVKKLSSVDLFGLAKGLGSVGVMLGMLKVFLSGTDFNKLGMAKGAGLIMLAYSITTLVDAVKKLGEMDIATIGKGLTAIQVLMMELTLFNNSIGKGKGIISSSNAIFNLSAAIVILSYAVGKLGSMDLATLAKGIGAIGASLLIIAGTMRVMPKDMAKDASALIAVAVALNILSIAIGSMGGMSLSEIAKGLVTMAASLLILSVAMKSMTGSLTGAAALLIIASALAILAPTLIAFGSMDLASIGKALLTLAGIFVIFGIAGYALGPVVPVIISLAGAMALFGLSIMELGAGIMMTALGFAALAAIGTAGISVLIGALTAIIGLIPLFMEQVALGITSFITTLGESAPQIATAFTNIASAILTSLATLIPQAIQTVTTIISALLVAIQTLAPQFVTTGMTIIMSFLSGIAANAYKFGLIGGTIVARFINGVAAAMPGIVNSAFNLIISFINTLANTIRNRMPQVINAILNLGKAIIQGLWNSISGVGGKIFSFIGNIVSSIGSGAGRLLSAAASAGRHMITGLVNSISGAIDKVKNALLNVAKSAWDGFKSFFGIKSPSRLMAYGGKQVIAGLVKGINDNSSDVTKATDSMLDDAYDSLSQAMKDMSEAFDDEVDYNPSITPVLNLDEISKNSKKIGGMLNTGYSLSLSDSVSKTGKSYLAFKNGEYAKEAIAKENSISFVQNNYSPKALSRIDIYRQTNTQLGKLRGALI